jgi:hypothetical protein
MVGFIPLIDEFTVPDDMPVSFFSGGSIEISHLTPVGACSTNGLANINENSCPFVTASS